MGKFCRRCGHPLENGRCPACDVAQDVSLPVSQSIEDNKPVMSEITGCFKSLFASGDAFSIIPVMGFVLLALINLLYLFNSLSSGFSYSFYSTMDWLSIIAQCAIGIYAVKCFRDKKLHDINFIFVGVSVLYGLAAILNLLSKIVSSYQSYNFLLPALLLLLFSMWKSSKNPSWSRVHLIGLVALIASMLLSIFVDDISFLFYISYIYAFLCAAVSYLRILVTSFQ